MTAPVLTPDASRCPVCAHRLTAPGACSSCGVPLTGPSAQRLWDVDVELLRLAAEGRALHAERAELVRSLRGEAQAPVFRAEDDPYPSAATRAAAAPEWTAQRVQNVLLALGGLLLGVAALVFAAVTYDRLGAGGRAAVLLTLTAGAALAVPFVRRRGLHSTAETLAAVTLVLGALDAYGLRTLGIGDGLSDEAYTAISAGVLAVLAGAAAGLVPVLVARTAAVLLAQLPVPLLLVDVQAGEATAGLALTALAAADLAVLALLGRRLPADVRALVAVCAGTVTAFAFLLGCAAALQPDPVAGAVALLALAALLAASAALPRDDVQRAVLLGLPVAVVALAVTALARPELTSAQLPVVPALVALVAALALQAVPRPLRPGPAVGATVVGLVALTAVSPPLLAALLAPFGWLAEPWSAAADVTARSGLSPYEAWLGTAVVPAVVALAAATSAAAAHGLGLLRRVLPATAGLALAAVVLLPVGLDLPLPLGLGLLLAVGAVVVLVPLPAGATSAAPAVRVGGSAVLLLAVAWSLADRDLTLVVLPLAALAVARLAAGAAGALLAAEVAALGAAQGLAADQVGGSLVPAAAVLLAAAVPALGSRQRTGVECAAGATALAAVVLAVVDVGWLSWVLAGLGLVALAGALRADRRRLALAGGLLLAASSWVRLADAGVEHPEPYVLPLALVALVLGHLRRRAVPGTGSFAAYGAGLSALLVPSLLAALAGGTVLRPLVLAAVALVVVLLGVRGRLQAPLLIGGTVLAVDALRLLGPYAAALPRCLVLGAAGAVLLGVGATYEQRLRELTGLRSRYAALG